MIELRGMKEVKEVKVGTKVSEKWLEKRKEREIRWEKGEI